MIKSNQTSAIQYLSLLSVAMHWKLGTSSLRFSFFVLVGNIFNSIRFFFYWFYGAIFSTAAEANHFSFWYIDLQIHTFSQIPFHILIFFPDSLIPNWLAAVLWQIRRKTLEALGANSHFPLPCPPYLGESGQLFQVFNCPWLGVRDQMELYRIWKLEYIIAFFFYIVKSWTTETIYYFLNKSELNKPLK